MKDLVELPKNNELNLAQKTLINNKQRQPLPFQAQGRNQNQHYIGVSGQHSPDLRIQANTIVPPNATLSSSRKLAEDKSFRHDFYSMDPAEAHDQLGANPISLGMDGDYGQTLTQTGLEAMIEDDLSMDMVMSRVDWIIQLRDIFYGLLDSTQHRQHGKIRAD